MFQSRMFDSPMYCGATILDLSKEAMYDFWYNHLMPLHDNDPTRLRLLATDTDSVIFWSDTDFDKDILPTLLEHGCVDTAN